MPKPYTTDGTPPTGDVIAGLFEFEIEEGEVRETSTGKFAGLVKAKTTENAPDGYNGRLVSEFFTIGTDEDPGADDPLTYGKKSTFGFRRLRDLMVAAKFAQSGDLEADIPRLKGHRFLAGVNAGLDRGEVRSKFTKFFPVGSRPQGTRTVDPETGKMGPMVVEGGNQPPPNQTAAGATGAPPPPPPQ